MLIYVKTPNNKTLTLKVATEDDISYVKAKIQAKEGIPPKKQALLYRNTHLQNDKDLADYNIQHGAILELRNGMQISVKTPRGQTIELEVLPEDTIDTIKAKIQHREGIPPM